MKNFLNISDHDCDCIPGGNAFPVALDNLYCNRYEMGEFAKECSQKNINFIGKDALKKIKQDGIKRKQIGLEIDCKPLSGPNTTFWKVHKGEKNIGKVTSAVYSPRRKKNIALAMVSSGAAVLGTSLEVDDGKKIRKSSVVPKPFYDPNKTIATST